MKFAQITLVFLIIALMCIVAAALPDLGYLTEDDCRNCHGNENGNTQGFHHMNPDFSKCMSCHVMPLGDDFRNCCNCHMDYNHHNEDAKSNCNKCHEDKQKQKDPGKKTLNYLLETLNI